MTNYLDEVKAKINKEFEPEKFPLFLQIWSEFFNKNKFNVVYLPKDDLFLKYFKKLQVIVTPSTGINHIDTDYCKTKNITVFCLLNDRKSLNKITASAEFTFASINYATSGHTGHNYFQHIWRSSSWCELTLKDTRFYKGNSMKHQRKKPPNRKS